MLVPLCCRADRPEQRRQLGSIAERTGKRRPDALGATSCSQDPRSLLERRTVPDVLIVAAGELGYPVAVIILMESSDRPIQLLASLSVWWESLDRQHVLFPACRHPPKSKYPFSVSFLLEELLTRVQQVELGNQTVEMPGTRSVYDG